MKNNLKALFMFFVVFIFVTGCNKNNENQITYEVNKPLKVSDVINKDMQAKLTPDEVIKSLKEGNKRFVENKQVNRDFTEQIKKTAEGQYPEAIILSCIDSRVPVELIFDKGLGDLFVARVAGNISNEDILGSMEYSCKVSGAKLVLVLGHSHCGAVKAAIDEVKLGNITELLKKIIPVVQSNNNFAGDKTTKNDEYVNMVTKKNVINTIENIRKNSSILKLMEDNGEIKIIGAFYDIETGGVEFL